MIIVTGATGGIGSAIANHLESKGHNVVRIDLPEYDLSTEKGCRGAAWRARRPLKGIVNVAGVSLPSYYGDADKWDKTFAVNVRAAYLLSSYCKQEMTEGGSIVNITSVNAEMATPMNPAYIASKGALKMLTKAMARDWGKDGIRVNNVCPGYIHTAMTHRSFTDPVRHENRINCTVLKRWGEPKDLVGIVAFLLSPESSYITGADFVVDGGWMIKGR